MNTVSKGKIPVCSVCGDDNIRVDAWAEWNVNEQEWELSTPFETHAVCEKCDDETSITWVSIEND